MYTQHQDRHADVRPPVGKLLITGHRRRVRDHAVTTPKLAVLLSAGSFNPPTYMHLRLFEMARDALEDEGWTVMGGYMSPVHQAYGKQDLAEAHHRVAMCERAVDGSDFIMVDPWEATQATYQRTLVVLRRARQQLLAHVRTLAWLEGKGLCGPHGDAPGGGAACEPPPDSPAGSAEAGPAAARAEQTPSASSAGTHSEGKPRVDPSACSRIRADHWHLPSLHRHSPWGEADVTAPAGAASSAAAPAAPAGPAAAAAAEGAGESRCPWALARELECAKGFGTTRHPQPERARVKEALAPFPFPVPTPPAALPPQRLPSETSRNEMGEPLSAGTRQPSGLWVASDGIPVGNQDQGEGRPSLFDHEQRDASVAPVGEPGQNQSPLAGRQGDPSPPSESAPVSSSTWSVGDASPRAPRVLLLCGADLLESFCRPGVWIPDHMEEIFHDFGIVCVVREGTDATRLLDGHELLRRHKDCILLVHSETAYGMSSTKIRREISHGRSVKYLIPDAVLDYIYAHKLYTDERPAIPPNSTEAT